MSQILLSSAKYVRSSTVVSRTVGVTAKEAAAADFDVTAARTAWSLEMIG